MNSLWNKLFGWDTTHKQQSELICKRDLWSAGTLELKNRTLNRRRESGAFLLGVKEKNGAKRITEFIYYDDIDPNSLDSGIVHFSGKKLPILWEICRERGHGVVADVHVHPGSYHQSKSDKENPVIPRAGHIAIIIPDYAQKITTPGGIGLYEYKGNGSWLTHTQSGSSFFKLD